jgi:predicted transcriptional regulator of viral defense system
MVWESQQLAGRRVWDLARRQHGVISRAQLHELGYSDRAIEHRLANRRLHRLFRGVYIVGRPEVSAYGRWFGAGLACGEGAARSHMSAARLWAVVPRDAPLIHVSVPRGDRRHEGIVVHRRSNLAPRDFRRRYRILVTAPATTIVDIAVTARKRQLERAINEADQLSVIRFDILLRELQRMPQRPGIGAVKALVLRHTFRLTRSELERSSRPLPSVLAFRCPKRRERGYVEERLRQVAAQTAKRRLAVA